jgi:hypothetical protein
MEFACSVCNYTSERKECVTAHINNKKTKCGEGIPEIIEIPVDIHCEFCNKEFATRPNLKRHLKTCKSKKINLEKEVKDLKEKLDEANRQLALKSSPTTINNNNNNNTTNNTNNTTNININFNLTSWRDPNYPDNMDYFYKEAVKKLFMSVPKLIELIHFNINLPENHNICIKNFRTKIAKVYNGKEWQTINEDQLLNDLINTYEGELENWADDEEHPNTKKYIEKYNEIKERDGKTKVLNDLKDEVKKLIYDKRSMIKIKN